MKPSAMPCYQYFRRTWTARVAELQKIVQDLGAKHFRVTYLEEKKSFSSHNIKTQGKGLFKGAGKVNADAEHIDSEKTYAKSEIAAEIKCDGHELVEQQPVFFQNDPAVRNLIDLRMADNT